MDSNNKQLSRSFMHYSLHNLEDIFSLYKIYAFIEKKLNKVFVTFIYIYRGEKDKEPNYLSN